MQAAATGAPCRSQDIRLKQGTLGEDTESTLGSVDLIDHMNRANLRARQQQQSPAQPPGPPPAMRAREQPPAPPPGPPPAREPPRPAEAVSAGAAAADTGAGGAGVAKQPPARPFAVLPPPPERGDGELLWVGRQIYSMHGELLWVDRNGHVVNFQGVTPPL